MPESTPYWAQSAGALLSALSSRASGLSSAEASERLRRFGPNTVGEAERTSALKLLLRQFESPLVLILVFGACVSLFVREWVDASIILAVVVGSTLLGFFQEYRASAAIAELRARLALTTRVSRDGVSKTIAVSDIVPGDIVSLSAGNLVPADGIVLEARDFMVSESALTGESFPVEKQPGTVAEGTTLSQRSNSVFFGTSVRSGTATVLAVKTGLATQFGTVAARLKSAPPETEFARGLRRFGYLLLRIMIVMVLFVLTVNQLLGRPVIESLLFAVALAVGLSPELLPAIVSVTLSAGARALAKRGVIVRRLEAIENLGGMDVLCTDKTGTLTKGVVTLSDATDPSGKTSDAVRRDAYLNAALETGIDNPLDAAIVEDGKGKGFDISKCTKLDEIPYDFQRKRLTIIVDEGPLGEKARRLLTKGAYVNVLAICTQVAQDGKTVALDDAARAGLEAFYKTKSAGGFRVLGLASKTVETKPHYSRDDESGLCFEGFLLFFDPPKPEVRQTIRDLAGLGIAIKIITGDNRYVAAHVAEAVGLDAKALLTGEQMAALTGDALCHAADRVQIFAEIDPQQKETLVRALQKGGHAVGYMGDGINDATALHTADVGISVDQAVDVARESADIVLLRPDLDVLRLGVEGGRRTFVNTLKYIAIATSSTFGNMISMALATPILPFLPLAAKQILLNNFLSDLPSIALSTDNVDAPAVTRPTRWDIRDIRKFMVLFGLLSSCFDGLTFFVLLKLFHAGIATFQTAWFVVSLLTELAAVLVLRTHLSVFRSMPSRLLLAMAAAIAILSLALPFIAPLDAIFSFVRIPATLIGALFLILAAYIAALEAAKRVYFRTASRTK
ncbi:MAG: magnesium-translocating P-type ATPase [Proteobacteria bacterium]|nr:magnesium-translocating P-type ATPase [Pseudomonadota bacterium]